MVQDVSVNIFSERFMQICFGCLVTISVQIFALFSLRFKGELYTWGQDEGDGGLGFGPDVDQVRLLH